MDTITDRRYPGHQRDIGHTLQLTFSTLLRVEADPETGDERFDDPEELQLAGSLLRELKTAVAFCQMAEKERWADELPKNLKPLCQELARTLAALGVVDVDVDAADDADEDDAEFDDADLTPDETHARPLTLPAIALLVDDAVRAWAQGLNVLLPRLA